MWTWLANLIGAKDVVKETLGGIGNLVKDIKTIATGKIDPEKAAEILTKAAQLEAAINQYQANVVTAEASGNWLQRSWRPLTMMLFLVLVILNQFGLLRIPLSDEVWELFKIGLGGYIGGRSLEKIAQVIKT